jgi:cytochrome b561
MPLTQLTAGRRYVASARWLHWIMALLLAAVATLGVWMTSFEPAEEAFKFRLYNVHQSLGVVVFVLVVVRLLVRWTNPPPPLPHGTPAPIHAAAAVSHFCLYVLMVVMPVIGLLDTNAWGFPLSWFDLFPIPSPIGKNEAIAPLLSTLHWIGALALGAIVAAHLLGAVYHQTIRRDRLLQRMT